MRHIKPRLDMLDYQLYCTFQWFVVLFILGSLI